MKYIDYVDFPSIPLELLPSFDDVVCLPIKIKLGDTFESKDANHNLINWCKDNIPVECVLWRYQLISGNLPKHKDEGNRIFCFNYTLYTGGKNTTTIVYKDDKTTELARESIIPHRWHYITTGYYHEVINNTEGRINLSVTPSIEQQKILLEKYIGDSWRNRTAVIG